MNDFLLAEHSQVRKEIVGFREDIRKLEQYAFVITGAVWAWVVANPNGAAILLVLWVFVAILAAQAEQKQNCIDKLQEYVLQVEQYFLTQESNLGLEGFLKSNPAEETDSMFRHFWLYLILGNFFLGFGVIMAGKPDWMNFVK